MRIDDQNVQRLMGIEVKIHVISPTPQMVQQTTTTDTLPAIDQPPSDQRLVTHYDRRSTNTPNNADPGGLYSQDAFDHNRIGGSPLDERNDSANIDMGERGAPSTPEPDVGCAENVPGSVTQVKEPESPDVWMADICTGNLEGDRALAEEQMNFMTEVLGQPLPPPFNSSDNQNSDNIDFKMADGSAPVPSHTDTTNSANHVHRSRREHRLVTAAGDPPTVDSHSKPKAGNSRKRKRRSPPMSAEEVREEDRGDKVLPTPGNDIGILGFLSLWRHFIWS